MSKIDEEFAPLAKRFDNDYANDGVWFDPYDAELGIEFPTFKLALLDTTSDRFIAAAERLQDRAQASAPKKGFRQPARMSKKDRETEEAIQFRDNFIEIAMVDWTVTNVKGEPLPFTKDRAKRYFDIEDQDKRWLFGQCVKFASHLPNFQPDGQEEAPEGN